MNRLQGGNVGTTEQKATSIEGKQKCLSNYKRSLQSMYIITSLFLPVGEELDAVEHLATAELLGVSIFDMNLD